MLLPVSRTSLVYDDDDDDDDDDGDEEVLSREPAGKYERPAGKQKGG